MRRIDLHCHTTASDGTLSPAALVRLAKEIGLAAVAITDHDTIDGLAEGLAEGERIEEEVISGVELSTDLIDRSVHILGYFIDPTDAGLAGKLAWAREARANRNVKIADRFRELGIPLNLEEVTQIAGGEVVGRPHFAKWLVDHGHVRDFQEAFNVYLGSKGKAYLPKVRLTPEEAIILIKGAGGLVVLAHPGTYERDEAWITKALDILTELGLDGLEVYYSQHSPRQTAYFESMARSRGLLLTGGSDFHGSTSFEVSLGTGKDNNLAAPYELLSAMKLKLDSGNK